MSMSFYVVSKTIHVPQCVLFHGKKEYTTKSVNMWGHLYRSLQSTMFWRVILSLKTRQGPLWKLGLNSAQKYENVVLCSWLRRKDKSLGASYDKEWWLNISTPCSCRALGCTKGKELLLEVCQLSLPMLLNINLFSLYQTLHFSKHF